MFPTEHTRVTRRPTLPPTGEPPLKPLVPQGPLKHPAELDARLLVPFVVSGYPGVE